MKLKNKLSISISLLVVFVFSLCFVTYAWIINRVNSPSIDGNTTGVKYVYELKDYQKEDYTIKNIAFFDINRESEKSYFIDMATCVEIVIENTGDINAMLTIKQIKPIISNSCYIQCVFTNQKISSIDSFKSFIQENEQIENEELLINESKTIYMYVFGVQLDETSNNEFLNQTYNFSIEIVGEGK